MQTKNHFEIKYSFVEFPSHVDVEIQQWEVQHTPEITYRKGYNNTSICSCNLGTSHSTWRNCFGTNGLQVLLAKPNKDTTNTRTPVNQSTTGGALHRPCEIAQAWGKYNLKSDCCKQSPSDVTNTQSPFSWTPLSCALLAPLAGGACPAKKHPGLHIPTQLQHSTLDNFTTDAS